jgi:hypothetical protein
MAESAIKERFGWAAGKLAPQIALIIANGSKSPR